MDDMLKDFVVEALELAVDVEEKLLQLERYPDDKEAINAAFRSFHTIKGGAGFMNLTGMVSACHLTENLFDALRTGAAAVTPIAIEAALQASGFVADMLDKLHNGASPESLEEMPAHLGKILTEAIEGKSAPAEVAPAPAPAPTPVVIAPEVVTVAEQAVAGNDAGYVADANDPVDWLAFYRAVTPEHVDIAVMNRKATSIAVEAAKVIAVTQSEYKSAVPSPAPAIVAVQSSPAVAPAVVAPSSAKESMAAAAAAASGTSGWDGVDRRGGLAEAKVVAEDSIRVDAGFSDRCAASACHFADQLGALVAWFEYRGEDEPSHLNVEVHCERSWGHPDLEEVQENFLDLIAGVIEQFEEISKEEPPASKAELGVDLSFIGALGDVCVEVPAKATEKEKREAGEKLAMFLAGMLNSGYFGKLLEESFQG